MFRLANAFCLWTIIIAAPASAAEFLVYDATYEMTEANHGFYFFQAAAGAPANWLSPDDYRAGNWQIRYEILSVPSAVDFNLQVCIWQEPDGTATDRETCSTRHLLDGEGDIVTVSTSPATWWQKYNDHPVDFARPDLFVHLGVPLWTADSCQVSDWTGAGNCWDQRANWLPLQFRVTIVAVSAGATFSGWSNYIDAQLVDNPEPIALHPTNPHYFIYRGQPVVLVTAGEHYGAVLNRDFDYLTYLDTLAADGLNYTRIFSGSYVEDASWFNYPSTQPLAPAAGRLIAPWARSSTPGYENGGNKFDLDVFDEAYVARLRDFVGQARDRGIIVELTLFCPYYDVAGDLDRLWRYSPFESGNNVNGVGSISRDAALTLSNGNLLAYQEAMVRKLVAELRDFDNVFYEIANEPYMSNASPTDVAAWQAHVAATIVDAESTFRHRHLIAQNINNFSATVVNPNPNVSILNFHYTVVAAVDANYALGRVIGNDETGFGREDAPYRTQAWQLILAGAGLQNVLDLSFLVGDEDGATRPVSPVPAGGGPTLRRQLRVLKEFIHSFDFVAMAPHDELVTGGVSSCDDVQVLAEPARQYAVYLLGGTQVDLQLSLAAGDYYSYFVDTKTGEHLGGAALTHAGGTRTFVSPTYADDIALAVVAPALLRPQVQITQPTPGAVFVLGSAISIEATASAPYSAVASVTFLRGGESLGVITVPPYRVVWTATSLGTQTLTARVADLLGETAEHSIEITVTGEAIGEIVLEAEEYDAMSGITNSGTFIEACDDGDWLRFDDVDLGPGYGTLTARLGRPGTDPTLSFSVRLDSLTGPSIASLVPQGTGGWQSFAEQSTTLNGGTGVHDLYVQFVGGWGVGNFDWFKLSHPLGPINLPPTVALIEPAAGAVLDEGASVVLTAEATDPDGSVALVRFVVGGEEVATVASAPYRVTWTASPVGEHLLGAVAVDDLGATASSTLISVRVTSPAPGISEEPTDTIVSGCSCAAGPRGLCWGVVLMWSAARRCRERSRRYCRS